MLYKHWLCKDLLHLLHKKSTVFPAQFYRRLHPAATGALEGNIGSFVLCHEMLWATSLQCSKGTRARHQEAHGTYQSPKCIQIRENFPMHGTSIIGDIPGNSWFTWLTFKCTESQSKQCWLFVMSRRKPPLDTSMSFFLIQAILIICGFHICEFAYSLKLINPQKATLMAHAQTFMNVCKAFLCTLLSCAHSQLRLSKDMLCLLVSILLVLKCSFTVSLVSCFHMFVGFVGDSVL